MIWRRCSILLACAGLAACAAPAYVSPVEVTRFVGDAPAQLGSGTISVDFASGLQRSPDESAYRTAVERELASLGYSVRPGNAAQVAQITLEQFVDDPDAGRRPVSVGGGASVGSYGSGVGLGIGLDLTPRAAERLDTRLSVAIRPAAGGENLWEGRAQMTASANSDYADQSAAASRLAAALFSNFPGTSGETIQVD
ncbi:DUF4136 domain-containing protein [Aurantiacibacter suaedae]|uniref:DUF4136 domain-containing protein n=1 Tax=Aurantiacibacter suaedae TaxID=2545755 RepID=UPI0010F965C4|nr:DUF4136 domain-containing protein [Aurantiacibacter suaedae]